MKHIYVLFAALMLAGTSALAQLPQRDLVVELRQIEEGGAGYSVGTQGAQTTLAPQRVKVRNGNTVSFSFGQTIPLQWVESASSHNASLSASSTPPGGSSSSAQASSSGGSVKQGLIWMEAGQKISVLPRWGGGKQDVTVEVQVQTAALQANPSGGNSDLPAQSHSQLVTTVGAPLGQWVTLAVTGAAKQTTTYSSEAAAEPRRLLQLRVSAP